MPIVYSQSYTAIPPGQLIIDQMDNTHMTFDEFAEQMNISFADSSRLLNGDIELTPDIAKQLEKIFDIKSHVWLKYEKSYREEIEQANAENAADDARRALELEPQRELALAD